MGRPQIVRVKCGHEGCDEFARYEAFSRKEAIEIDRKYGQGRYRCVRHSQPEVVLSPTNFIRVDELSVFAEPHGKYWGHDKASSGFVYGPGFKAFAADFPEGTIIRITAEIVLPSACGGTAHD